MSITTKKNKNNLQVPDFPTADVVVLSFRGFDRGDPYVVKNKQRNAAYEQKNCPHEHRLMPDFKKRTGLNIFHIFGLTVLNIKIKRFKRAHLPT